MVRNRSIDELVGLEDAYDTLILRVRLAPSEFRPTTLVLRQERRWCCARRGQS